MNPPTTGGQTLWPARGGGTSSDPAQRNGTGGAAAPTASAVPKAAGTGVPWLDHHWKTAGGGTRFKTDKQKNKQHETHTRVPVQVTPHCVRKETESSDYFS